MKYEVKSRFTGGVLFVAEIECDERARADIKLGLAVRWAIKNGANLEGAYLGGANLENANLENANLENANLENANLENANLGGANLRGAHLGGAYLENTNLRGAHLENANLGGAYLRGAYLGGANLIHCGHRSDGYEFFAHMRGGNLWVKAGCRYFNIADARAHWSKTRADTQLGDESQALCDNAERLARIRGMIAGSEQ